MTAWRAADLQLPEQRVHRELLAAVRPWLEGELPKRPGTPSVAATLLEQLARSCAELARRHPAGPAALQVFEDDQGRLCARVVMDRPVAWPPAGPVPEMLKGPARKRLEAMLKKGPPKRRPWTSGVLVLQAAKGSDHA